MLTLTERITGHYTSARKVNSGCDGIVTTVAWDNDGNAVSHACVIFDPAVPTVGLFGAVITHPDHRQRGLSKVASTCAKRP